MSAVAVRGIDVSHYQGTVNWKTKKSTQRLSFGMAKCTEGTSFFDTQYLANREACHSAGMPFIAYHYAVPSASSALAQAQRFVAKAGKVEGLCLDLEVSSLSQAQTNAWMRAFGDALRSLAPGVTTFAYLGGYAANGSGQSAVNHFDRWIYPHYTMGAWPSLYTPKVGGNTTGWAAPPAPHVWQCSDNIGGTDADVSDLTVSQLFSTGGFDLSDTQFEQVMAAIAGVPRGVAMYNDPKWYPGGAVLYTLWGEAAKAVNLPTADEIAAAVVAALPPAQTGGLTQADVEAAVKSVFAQAGATS